MTLSLAVFKTWVRTEIGGDDTLNQQAIDSSLELLASESGRNFDVVTEATAAAERTFRPTYCSDVLWITDCADIVSVEENGVALTEGTDYIAEPDGNRDQATGDWRPYSVLYRLDQSWYTNGRRRTVTIDGKWGWSTESAALTEAMKVLTADWLSMRNSRNGVVAVTTDGFSIGARSNPLVVAAVKALQGPLSIGLA